MGPPVDGSPSHRRPGCIPPEACKLNKLSTCHGRCARSRNLGLLAWPCGSRSMGILELGSPCRPDQIDGSCRTSRVSAPWSSSRRSWPLALEPVPKTLLMLVPHPLSRAAPWISGELGEEVVARAVAATKRGKVASIFEPELADSTTSPTCSSEDCVLGEHGTTISSHISKFPSPPCFPTSHDMSY